MPELSVIIPCYNEAKNIPVLLERFASFSNSDFELVLVNNGSTDDSAAVLARELKEYSFARSVLVEKNIGYGHGIMSGLRAARSEVVAYTHADLQCNPADVFRAFDLYKNSGGLVKGVRIHRRLSAAMLARGLDIVASLIMRMRFYDINAQPKLFSREFLQRLHNVPNGYYLDLYIVARAMKSHVPIIEMPVIFERRLHGVSSWQRSLISRVKNIVRFFFACFEVRRLIQEN